MFSGSSTFTIPALDNSVEMLALSHHTDIIAQNFFSNLDIEMAIDTTHESSPWEICQAIDAIIQEIAPKWEAPEHDETILSSARILPSNTQNPAGRLRMSAFSTYCLERVFAASSRPLPGHLKKIASLLDIDYSQVQNWFRNQRAYRVANPVSALKREMQVRDDLIREIDAVKQDNRLIEAEIASTRDIQEDLNQKLVHELYSAVDVLHRVQSSFGTEPLPPNLADAQRTVLDIEMKYIQAARQPLCQQQQQQISWQQNALPDSVQAQPELEEGFKEIIESICDDLAKYDENDGFEEFAPITAAEEEPKEMDQTDR